jgi:hypothetical protein
MYQFQRDDYQKRPDETPHSPYFHFMVYIRSRSIVNLVVLGFLAVGLIVVAFVPILPESSVCGGKTTYASLLRNVWNTKVTKKTAPGPAKDCLQQPAPHIK